jgi:lipopolysaccharide/colanic/teichoic acid biosynthesis glycosyltransferase
MMKSSNSLVYRYRTSPALLRRIVDVALAASFLMLALPILTLASIAVLIEDGWPIVFSQRRVGRFERSFTIYKLRTMYKNQCFDRAKPSDRTDPRITRVGRILRRLSIDEVPQFLNVIRGDMSIVGPRPEMPHIVKHYLPWQHLRHLVAPGITCFWQSEARGVYPLHSPEATTLDLLYIEQAGVVTDARILARTVPSVLTARGSV